MSKKLFLKGYIKTDGYEKEPVKSLENEKDFTKKIIIIINSMTNPRL